MTTQIFCSSFLLLHIVYNKQMTAFRQDIHIELPRRSFSLVLVE